MSEAASLTVVRVTAAAACLAGLTVIAWLFAGAVRVFPGPAALAAIVELPPLLIGFWVLRLLRPVQAPSLGWSAAAVVWGIAAATGCALLANDALTSIWAKTATPGFAANWGAALAAPLDEEIVKLCGVAMIALAAPRAIRGPVDGLIFGGLVGLGFQVTENATYGLGAIVLNGATSPATSVLSSAGVRLVLTGFGSHWAMTAVAGAGIGVLAARGRRGWWLAAVLLLLAMAMHFWFDSPPLPLPDLADDLLKPAVNLAVFLALYLVLRRRHMARARAVLAEEAAGRDVPPAAAGVAGRGPSPAAADGSPVPEAGRGGSGRDAAASLLSRRRRRRARREVRRGAPRQELAAWQQAQLSRLEDGIAARQAPPGPAPRSPAAAPS